MIVIETCPKCGCDLYDEMILTFPPIRRKSCYNCGWHWTDERKENVVRIPFGGNSFNNTDSQSLNAFNQTVYISCQNNPKNGGT